MPYGFGSSVATVKKSNIIQKTRTRAPKESLLVDVFAGIDRSTARHRLAGGGTLMYETQNIFPYIQGRLMRRKDYVSTNSRDSNNAFALFPKETMIGNPIVHHVTEFNGTICIIYVDDGDASPQDVLMDSFNVGTNVLTNRIAKTDTLVLQPGGKVDAAIYGDALEIDRENAPLIHVTTAWAAAVHGTPGEDGDGICEVFLQSLFHVHNDDPRNKFGRTSPGGVDIDVVTYNLAEGVGSDNIVKLMSFGYQTSAEGAYTNLLIFRSTNTWLMTNIGTSPAATIEQVSANVGLVGPNAIIRTPYGVVFVGKDRAGGLNIYLLDRTSLTLHTIGHPLYEVLNDIPAANYSDIFLSYDRNRMVKVAITDSSDSNINEQEWWIDFYNGIKRRTFWGPFPLGVQSMSHAIEFSGGINPANAGYFFLEKSGDDYLIREEVDTDTYQASFVSTDNQILRTQMFDFGAVHAIISRIYLVALDNGAKFKVSYEVPKTGGVDDGDTTITQINGTYQMGTTRQYVSIPIRPSPKLRVKQFAIKVESVIDVTDNAPIEPSQIGFDYVITTREVIE